jgi:serine/threonine protein kinase
MIKDPDIENTSTAIRGTPHYVAPECLIEEKCVYKRYYILFFLIYIYDFRYFAASDVWSFGVILFYMMYFIYPYDSNNYMILSLRIRDDKKNIPPPERNDFYSEKLRSILSSTL